MMRRAIGKVTAATLLLVALGNLGSWISQSARDRRGEETMTENLRVICIGRFLVDLPREAEVILSGARIQGFDIATFEEPEEAFQRRVASREAQLRNVQGRGGAGKNLEMVREVGTEAGLVGKIFVHGRTVTEGTAARGLELERYRYESLSAEALVHGKGISIDIATDAHSPDRISQLDGLVSRIVPNPGNPVPGEPGFCLDLAYVGGGPTAAAREAVTMRAGLPRHPDLGLTLHMAAGTRPDRHGLLDRAGRAWAALPPSDQGRVTNLRARVRMAGMLQGEELVRQVEEDHGAIGLSFWWEVNGTEHDPLVPHLVFRMETGSREHRPVPSSLPEDAAFALWDRIVSSIRASGGSERQ